MKLLEHVRQVARVKHFSYRTEQCYAHWIERFIRFHRMRHPNTMGASEAEQFLTHLAVEGLVAASTQNQALAALLFLYRDVLKIELGLLNSVRARRPQRVPTVLSRGDPPAGNEAGHSHGSRTAGAQRRADDHDLHARHGESGDEGEKPAGCGGVRSFCLNPNLNPNPAPNPAAVPSRIGRLRLELGLGAGAGAGGKSMPGSCSPEKRQEGLMNCERVPAEWRAASSRMMSHGRRCARGANEGKHGGSWRGEA